MVGGMMLSASGAGPHLSQGCPWSPPGESPTQAPLEPLCPWGTPNSCAKHTHLFEGMNGLAEGMRGAP